MRRPAPLLTVLAACCLSSLGIACSPTLAPVYAPSSHAGMGSSGQAYSPAQIEQAVLRAASGKDWVVLSHQPGLITAEVTTGPHRAEVRVRIAADGWQIEHARSSPGLRFGTDSNHGQVIHRRYNHWVRLLDEAIRAELGALRFVATTPATPSAGATPAGPPPGAVPLQAPVPPPAPPPQAAPPPPAGQPPQAAPAPAPGRG